MDRRAADRQIDTVTKYLSGLGERTGKCLGESGCQAIVCGHAKCPECLGLSPGDEPGAQVAQDGAGGQTIGGFSGGPIAVDRLQNECRAGLSVAKHVARALAQQEPSGRGLAVRWCRQMD